MKSKPNNKGKVVGVAGGAPATERHDLVKIAQSLVELNARDKEIQAQLTESNARSSKLYAEQNGLQQRRIQLQRQFDAAAKD